MSPSFRQVRFVTAALAAATAGAAAFQMYALSAEGRLWGVRPLIFLLGFWVAIVALRQGRERVELLGWGSVAGVLLGISQAPYGAVWAPVLGFAGLLVMVRRMVAMAVTKKQALWYAFHAMVVFNVVATWWVANTALAAGVVANFLNAFFQAVVVLLVFGMAKHQPKVWLVGAVATWIGFEYLHFNWQIAWPWLCLGHTFAPAPVLAQWFSVTGVFGGSLYVTLAGVCLYRTWMAHRLTERAEVVVSGRPVLRSGIIFAAVAIAPLALSIMIYGVVDEEPSVTTGRSVRVAAVQPNYEPHYAKFEVDNATQLEHFDALTGEALDAGAELVIYPETSFGGVAEGSLPRAPFLGMWSANVAARPTPADLIAGISSYRRLPAPNGDPALRTQTRPDGRSSYYIAHNAAVGIAGDRAPQLYYKSRLVPGVEFLPYRRLLFFFEPLVASLGGTTAGLGRSDAAVVFELGGGVRAAPLICYESIYGDYVREFVQGGANLLVVPTNDGWWDDSPGHRQHFNLARLRAIETRRWVVQAANSGTSGFIDPRGRAFAKTAYDVATVTAHDAELLGGSTLYVRWGDVVGRVMAGGASLLLLSLFGKTLKR